MDALYCTQCWAELPAGAVVCSQCGAKVNDPSADITDKYISALRHPQAETRLRAAWMLGRMQATRAIPVLLEIVHARGQGDPYLLSAAVQSLGQIGDDRALPVLQDSLDDGDAAFMARVQAVNALSHILSLQSQAARHEAVSDPNERMREAAFTLRRSV
jgi:HEAT repeat protein